MGNSNVSVVSGATNSGREVVNNNNERRQESTFSKKIRGFRNGWQNNVVKPVAKRTPSPRSVYKRRMKSKTDKLAEQAGGKKTWSFRQGTAAMRSTLKKNGVSGGICASLTANWIKGKVIQEQSLQKNLGQQSLKFFTNNKLFTRESELNLNKLGQIAKQQAETPATQFRNWVTKQTDLIIDDDVSVDTLSFPKNFGYDKRDGIVAELCDRLRDLEVGHFAEISIHGTLDTGHAMGVEILEDDTVNFFDPNKGEFSFPDKESFVNFFERFYSSVYVDNTRKPLDGGFMITAFKKRR